MKKSIEELNNGKDAHIIILDLESKIEELQLCIQENAGRSQRIIFNLESKVKSLDKENNYLRSRNT